MRGKGYYVERGVVYKKNGTPIYVSKTGYINLTGAMGKQERVGLGWVLFAAYPDFYGYKHGIHTQMDHINGISTDNEAWNFRPMTVHQNAAVRHRTGFTIPPPITQLVARTIQEQIPGINSPHDFQLAKERIVTAVRGNVVLAAQGRCRSSPTTVRIRLR